MKPLQVLLFVFTGFFPIALKGQVSDDIPIRCGPVLRESYFSKNAQTKEEGLELEQFIQHRIQEKKELAGAGIQKKPSKYIIPVVFHVFGRDFAGKKVDDALVRYALKKTNEDFNGLNDDFNEVSTHFKPLRATLDVEFRLAAIDPNGNPTTGINYYTNRVGFGEVDTSDKRKEIAEFAWDNYKYMNVYILLDLDGDGILSNSGIAFLPNKNQSDENLARVVFNGRYLGTNTNENQRRILTHEFGHYLNLHHTFKGGCKGSNDHVDDTPATTVNRGFCLVTEERCPGAGIPNSENFMDYSDCSRMFTFGQAQRMEAALASEARHPLWQTANHAKVFSQDENEPKLYYDFTTFSETVENDGAVYSEREVKIRLANGPRFSVKGTLPVSSYTTENLPPGLSVQVVSQNDTEAIINLTGKAVSHSKSNSIRNLKLTFKDAAFANYPVAAVKGYSKPDLRIEFNDAYESTYVTYDQLTQVAVDGNSFAAFGINEGGENSRYELYVDHEALKIGFGSGAKQVAVNDDGKVLFLGAGTDIGTNLNWSNTNAGIALLDDVYQDWKGQRGLIGLRIERLNFPGEYYYGWARLEVSADGKLLRFINFYSNNNSASRVRAGFTDKPLAALSKPVFFEDEENNGKVSDSIAIILEGAATFTSQRLDNGIHYRVDGLPEGFTPKIEKVNEKLAKLTLEGTAANHLKGDGTLLTLRFLNTAFNTAPVNRTNFEIRVRFFDPYGITYIDTSPVPWVNSSNQLKWVHLDTDYDNGDNSRFGLQYTNAGHIVLLGMGRGFTMDNSYNPTPLVQGSQISASSKFVSTRGYSANFAPKFAGTDVPFNGQTIYTGFRVRDRAGRLHYGWVRVEAKPDGSGARLLAVSYNRQPDAPITVGQVENTHCYAGSRGDKIDNYSNGIGTFRFEHFSQKSDLPQNYTDFTSREIKVRPGINAFSVESDGEEFGSEDMLGIWVDFNNDNDFEDDGEEIYRSEPFNTGVPYSGEVTLPDVEGTYTLRVTVKSNALVANPLPSPCDFFLHGEVEDYTINIAPSHPVYPMPGFKMPDEITAKSLLAVTDNSEREPDSWSWTFEGGEPASFEGKDPPSVYYSSEGNYRISLTVKKGSVSSTLEKTLTVNPHAEAYCDVSRKHSYPGRGDIIKVVLGNINNETPKGGSGYHDFTHLSANLIEGQSYPFEITTFRQEILSFGATTLKIYIDWNKNNEFSTDEVVYERRPSGTDDETMVLTGNITVPKIYSEGASVMRIISYYSYDDSQGSEPPCGSVAEADVEDYTVNLLLTCEDAAARSEFTDTHSQQIPRDIMNALRTDKTTLPDVVNSQCEVTSLTPPTASTGCAGTGTTVEAALDVTFPIKENTRITWKYTHKNESIVQTQQVIVDTAPPTVTGVLDAIIERCEVTENAVNAAAPAAPADNCPGAVLVTHDVPNNAFPIMSGRAITWTYTDVSGNTATQTQQVTITDSEVPAARFMTLSRLTKECRFEENDLNLERPTAMDNCSGEVMATHNFPAEVFPITSDTTITWTYTDAAGNTVTQMQEVTITADKTAPVPAMPDLLEITEECQLKQAAMTAPKAMDTCDGEITATHDVAAFPITSNTTITWTYRDEAGNTATQTQEVTITADKTAPVPAIRNLSEITVACQLKRAAVTAPTAYDTCNGQITSTTDAIFPITANETITWTYTDASDNTTTQTQEVIVDTKALVPRLNSLPPLTAECGETIASLNPPTARNCSGNIITATHDVNLPIKTNTTITWTYTDGSNNTAMQTQEVKIADCPFITKWETTTANESITIPTLGRSYRYSYTVDWGDESTDNTTYTGDATHIYANAGTHIVTISGDFPRIRFAVKYGEDEKEAVANAAKIRTIEQWGDMEWVSMAEAFRNCSNLTIADDAGSPDLSRVIGMWDMFNGASLAAEDLSDWNVSSVRSMQRMFAKSSFNGDLSGWNVSSVTDMNEMFYVASAFNGDLSGWNVSSVTDMFAMFSGASAFNGGDLSGWNVSSVTNMSSMFAESSFNGDLSGWDVSSVTSMSFMFSDASAFNGEGLNSWDVSSVTNMRSMFYGASAFIGGDLSGWNVSNVTDMEGMFRKSSFTGDLSNWDVSNVTNMSSMFSSSALSSENYDKLLIGWNTLDMEAGESQIPKNITFGAPDHYSCAGEAAREKLVNDYLWVILGDSKLADAIAPVPVVADLIAHTAACKVDAVEELTAPTANDVCDGEIKGTTDADFPITVSQTITWKYEDEAGNMSDQTQLVTIILDGTVPVPVLPDLPEISEACKLESGDVTAPTAKDCSGTILTGTHNITTFPVTSNTTIEWTYTDNDSNTSTQTQAVTITDESPVLPVLNPITVACNLERNAVTAPKATDTCDGEIEGTTDTVFPITESGTIEWTYTDSDNNTATQTQTVNITLDGTDPVPVLPDLPAISEACKVEAGDESAPVARDCSGTTLTGTTTAFPITESGTITWTYTDNKGNTATQTQEVTITACPPEESELLSVADDAVEAVVFPNPSGRYVEVQSPVESPIRILSLEGKPLLEGTTNTRIDAASLRSGLYLIQLPDGRLLKFVKK
ncbi:MAG: BspA family leucine-rich repeat surface protein [Ekhidna sp.]|nr:BspA family leucine-rich repeat surface protein [Ekhidna sp.]